VVSEELLAAGAPVTAHWIADRQSAPLILRHGTEAQKQRYLPPICAGEMYFCIGMSEPASGSDLASVRTKADRQPDGSWLLNGRKVWTTNADRCHAMIALVRTDPASERHAGLSQIIVLKLVDKVFEKGFQQVKFILIMGGQLSNSIS
jgi:acyl-CoA dehydrogenase